VLFSSVGVSIWACNYCSLSWILANVSLKSISISSFVGYSSSTGIASQLISDNFAVLFGFSGFETSLGLEASFIITDLTSYLTSYLTSCFASYLASYLALYIASDIVSDLASDFASDLASDFASDLASDFASDLTSYTASYIISEYVWGLASG